MSIMAREYDSPWYAEMRKLIDIGTGEQQWLQGNKGCDYSHMKDQRLGVSNGYRIVTEGLVGALPVPVTV